MEEQPHRIAESILYTFASEVFVRLGVSREDAESAARSLLDASLMGIETHGIEALPMYVNHLQGGGLKADAQPQRLLGSGAVELWDIGHGLGLAAGRIVMARAIEQARAGGIYLAACRNANHLGACGVYAKMAADAGLIGMVSQQTLASLAPWGGLEPRIGASPFALAAPVRNGFPFYFDASMAAMTRAQIKAHRDAGRLLPEGVALDAAGQPTRDPEKAWHGQILPIGAHKGVGLAMVFEILSCVLSGNQFSQNVPSIVDHPERSADSGFFVMAIDPAAIASGEEFADNMRRYIEYVESSAARDATDPPRYPGRREGAIWSERSRNGIPVSAAGRERLNQIAVALGLPNLNDN